MIWGQNDLKTYKRMSFLVINMLLVIAFCSTWLLSFITHSNHVHSNEDIDNDKGRVFHADRDRPGRFGTVRNGPFCRTL